MRINLPAGSLFLSVAVTLSASAQTRAQQKVCNSKGPVAEAYCPNLSQAFDAKKLENSSALVSVFNQSILLTSALRNKAYLHVLASTLKGDAKNLSQSDAQTVANDLAQLISTKAAVPQTGASAAATASTSLVAKPTTTDLISLAAESGAFTDTVNGNTVTAQANVNGLRRYITNNPFASLNGTWEDLLQHMTVSATFNVAQASSAAATTTGQATSTTPSGIASVLLPSNNISFNALGVSVSVYRPYNPTSSAFNSAWTTALGKQAADVTSSAQVLYKDYQTVEPKKAALSDFFKKPNIAAALDKWKSAAAADEARGDPAAFGDFVDSFVAYMDAIDSELENDPSFDQSLVATARDLDGLRNLRDTVLYEARGKPIVTFNYNYTTPANKPAQHSATAVVGYVWRAGPQLTGNLAGDWFATLPAKATYGRVKDYQFSSELDLPIGKDKTAPRATASLAGYGQYQYAANVLNITVANVVPGTDISVPANSQVFTSTPGWLAVAQAKVVFNIGKGATVPVAVKWSDKTDLLTGSNWKGQFGISYDLSALKSVLLGTLSGL